MAKKMYIVCADTYKGETGACIELFGVFDTHKKAKKVEEEITKELSCPSWVEEFNVNKRDKKMLGRYVE